MGLDELKREIIAQAKAEAERVIAQAKAHAEQISADARASAERARSHSHEETARLLGALEQRELAASSLERKKALMAAKKDVLDEVFAKTRDALAKMPAAERKALVQSLVKRASAEIPVETVYCNAKDASFVTGFKTSGADISGGIIAQTKDGAMRVDYSYETMLEELRERHLEELGRIVFKA